MSSSTIPILTPELASALRNRSHTVLAELVRANSSTIYFQESPILSCFRETLAARQKISNISDSTDIACLFAVVPFSTDTDYAPFVSRFNEIPCRTSRIRDLLAPGYPNFLCHTSGTTGGLPKIFPKYAGYDNVPLAPYKNMSWIVSCGISDVVNVIKDDNNEEEIVGLPLCTGTSGFIRMRTGVGFVNDKAFMAQKLANTTSPFAAYLIQPYRSILLIHGLFAMADRSLRDIMTTFSVLLYDYVRLLVEKWDMLVEAIDSGTLPNLDGLDNVAIYLQDQLRPDPLRAAELRDIDVGSEGWLKRVWPQLTNAKGIFSGPYSAVVPKIRYHLGSSVSLTTTVCISTECHIGSSVSGVEDLNLFKVESNNYVEYLDVEKPESPVNICQAWEIETGHKYELVVTTGDGLWRYRLGDVLEVAGFDPIDGQPCVRYIERRFVTLRVAGVFMNEQGLRDGLYSLKDCLGDVLEFTSFADDRYVPRSYGFIVELGAGLGPTVKNAVSSLHSFFCANNQAYREYSAGGSLGEPSISIVAPGTFQQYREWKYKVRNCGSGQMKVPAVIHDAETREWFSERIILEL